MEKELETANEIVTANVSGGFQNFKETVYTFLAKFFSWLSTHQGLALIIILGVLIVMTWLILKNRKSGKLLEEKVSSKNAEIGEKDALIEEQKNNLEVLQKKLSNQQRVVSKALLKTMMTLTGYDIDQLQFFFKSLAGISKNPLQIAARQANAMPKRQQLKEESDNSTEGNDAKEKSENNPVHPPPDHL